MFNNCNRNKLGVTLNMRDPRGRELAERLITESSVVTENFAPGVMERWGLTEEHVRELRPDVIYARMSGFGHSGPYADYRSYGPVVQAVCGLSHISGLPGREPSGWGLSYMDNQAAYYNSAALMMAILARNATGVGTDIDVSAVEAGVELLGPVLLDVAVNGRGTRRPDYPTGNRLDHPARRAPRRVPDARGRTAGSRSPCSTTTSGRRSSTALGSPPWASDARFATNDGRVAQPGRPRPRDRRVHRRTRPSRADAPAAGRRRARRRGAERRGRQRARSADGAPRRVLRARSSGDRRGPVRGRAVHRDAASHPTTGARRRCSARTTTTSTARSSV